MFELKALIGLTVNAGLLTVIVIRHWSRSDEAVGEFPTINETLMTAVAGFDGPKETDVGFGDEGSSPGNPTGPFVVNITWVPWELVSYPSTGQLASQFNLLKLINNSSLRTIQLFPVQFCEASV